MNEKLTLSFTVATFVAAVSMVWFLRGTMDRLSDLEEVVAERPATRRVAPRPRVPDSDTPADPTADGPDFDPDRRLDVDAVLRSKDLRVKLDHLIQKLERMSDDDYDTYNEIATDLLQLKKEVGRVKFTVRRIARGLREGGAPGFASPLPTKGAELDEAARGKLKDLAARMGIEVEDGRVTLTGTLNLSPNTNMPIEYFMARYPEAGHETLMHVLGNKSRAVVDENPYGALAGLPLNIYRALLAAGFKEGQPLHMAEGSDPRDPTWVLPSGDTIYLYMRWTQDGKEHVARATDWVLNPRTGDVLPHDCLRFTGSIRYEDHESGDESIRAEQTGLIVGVSQGREGPSAIVTVGLEESLHTAYRYNAARIPKSESELKLTLIFSKTPMEVKGDGAKPVVKAKPVKEGADGDGDAEGDG